MGWGGVLPMHEKKLQTAKLQKVKLSLSLIFGVGDSLEGFWKK